MGSDEKQVPPAEEVHGDSSSASSEWDIRKVLPDDGQPWYRKPHFLMLNLLMLVPYLSSTTNGYDGSMLNGLQSMSQWQELLRPPDRFSPRLARERGHLRPDPRLSHRAVAVRSHG